MTYDSLVDHIIAHTETMYYVSYTLLHHKADQEDAVQQTIEKALRKYAALRDEKQVRAWLTRILVNECYNTMRKRKREFPVEVLPCAPPTTADSSAFYSIMSLPETYRLPIVLHYQQGYTTKEAAKILRIPESTVKGRLVRGRKELSQLLQQEGVLV